MKNKTSKQNRKMKLVLFAVVAALVLGLAVGGVLIFGNKPAQAGQDDLNAGQAETTDEYSPVPTAYVEIEVKDVGVMQAELYGDTAPLTVANFLRLVDEGFYDGLTFHRIINGFMIQGGDPEGDGTGGSKEAIRGEFASNGVQNDLKHTRGVMSMARTNNPDSASSQFFIMHQAAPHLDGAYAAFGKVISGMEVVDALCENTPVLNSNGMVAREKQPVITAIRRIEKP